MVDYSQLVPFVPAVAAVSSTVFMLGSDVAVVVGSAVGVDGSDVAVVVGSAAGVDGSDVAVVLVSRIFVVCDVVAVVGTVECVDVPLAWLVSRIKKNILIFSQRIYFLHG